MSFLSGLVTETKASLPTISVKERTLNPVEYFSDSSKNHDQWIESRAINALFNLFFENMRVLKELT